MAKVPRRSVTTKTYYWDFFGPRAPGTATHFAAHMVQFLEQHGVPGCVIDTLSEGEGHQAARCVAPEAAWSIIESGLRPRRSVD